MVSSVVVPALWILFISLICLLSIANTQLLINVKNQGGDVLQETITANVSEDAVMLEFQRSDGTLVTQLVDFRHEVQILKALVLGEEERGQSQYQVMCFVCHISKDEFISSDAMAKLRQKNPGTVRSAEEDRGRSSLAMDLLVEVAKSGVISRHVATLCAEAADATYTRRADVDIWANLPAGPPLSALLGVVHTTPGADAVARCTETPNMWSPCTCRLELCVGWYPCGLKYCKSKAAAALPGDNNASSGSYRCGIKTCRKCDLFAYHVRHKQLCLWDE